MSSASLPENPIKPHHRNIGGGQARAAVFGVSDGLVSNVSLVMGVAGAQSAQGLVRVAGLAGLVAGACSMAAGEYISMKAQNELLERELDMERTELAHRPELEARELAALYAQRGVHPEVARQVSEELMKDPEAALAAHAREELGIDPESLGSPVGAAISSLGAFSVGAVVPLLPWFFTGGVDAVVISIVLSAIAALAVGYALGYFTGRSRVWSATRQLGVSAGVAALTYAIGSLVGIGAV